MIDVNIANQDNKKRLLNDLTIEIYKCLFTTAIN